MGNLGEGKKYTYPGGPTCGHLLSAPASLTPKGWAAVCASWTMRAMVKMATRIQSLMVTGKSAVPLSDPVAGAV